MLCAGEVINLFFGIIALFLLPVLVRPIRTFDFKMFKAGYLMLLLAYLFTVIEGVLWHDIFNLLEHTCYALFGFCFCYACTNMQKSEKSSEERRK